MAVYTVISAAQCKDCQFLIDKVGRFKNGNIKITHVCSNPNSPEFDKQRAKRDLVCDKWEL